MLMESSKKLMRDGKQVRFWLFFFPVCLCMNGSYSVVSRGE